MSKVKFSRIATILVAVVGTEVFSSTYDDILYPIAIKKFGALYGGVGISILAVIINFLLVVWYRRTSHDWYGFENDRLIEAEEALKEGVAKRSKSRLINFIVLSVNDPFLGFAYIEGRKQSPSMNKRDWTMFALANAIGIGFWLFFLVGLPAFISSAVNWYFGAGTLDPDLISNWLLNIVLAWGIYVVLRIVFKTRRT